MSIYSLVANVMSIYSLVANVMSIYSLVANVMSLFVCDFPRFVHDLSISAIDYWF